MTEHVMTVLEQKFSSGNNVPVSRIVLTREEYESILEYIEELENNQFNHLIHTEK